MPLTKKGKKIKRAVVKGYTRKGKSEKEAEGISYAMENSGKVKGVKRGKKK